MYIHTYMYVIDVYTLFLFECKFSACPKEPASNVRPVSLYTISILLSLGPKRKKTNYIQHSIGTISPNKNKQKKTYLDAINDHFDENIRLPPTRGVCIHILMSMGLNLWVKLSQTRFYQYVQLVYRVNSF